MTTATTVENTVHTNAVNSEHILQIGMGFWASKTLLSAVELELFTLLGATAATGERDRGPPRPARSAAGTTSSTPSSRSASSSATATDPGALRQHAGHGALPRQGSPAYLGGILEMANARLYGFWGSLTEALHTGLPQNEIKTGARPLRRLYADPSASRFLDGMHGLQLGAFIALLPTVDLGGHATFVRHRRRQRQLAALVASRHPAPHWPCVRPPAGDAGRPAPTSPRRASPIGSRRSRATSSPTRSRGRRVS